MRAPTRVPRSQRAELAAKLKAEYEATKQTIGALAERHGLGYSLVSALLHEAGATIRQGWQA
ncbi:helix-turn-helix domain-containing protein [Streptomyces ardesiacus]|uniref:helix-turn-helix domain-containing protein n=1 Tax=Streptomyces ardesiacus TaxID=285564 RepID=UPI0033E2C3EF